MTSTATLASPVDSIRDLITDGAPDVSDDTLARIAWSVTAEPGDVAVGAIVAALGPIGALAALLDNSELVGDDDTRARVQVRFSARAVAHAIATASRTGMTILTPEHQAWPTRLGDLGTAAPHTLWCLGDPALLATAQVCVTGARAATGYGEHIAADLTADLTRQGHGTVSGGAYGIEGARTRAALAAGGRPVVVMAGGVDRLYPAGHSDLLERVIHTGVVVSEVAPGTPPTRWRFQQRGRILAALATDTIVVEAGSRSGALSTAAHAANLGRNVYAVPGPITSPASTGCHRLISDRTAAIFTGIHDLVETE